MADAPHTSTAGRIGRFFVAQQRRLIYVLVGVVVVSSYLLGTPSTFTPSPLAKNVYDKVNSLKPGDHILVAMDYDPSSEAELQPMALALLRHCFKKGVIPIVMTHWVAGLNLDKMAVLDAAKDANSQYGKNIVSGRDYAFLGYRPGWEQLILHMNENIKTAFDTDYFGESTEGMPALKGVTSLKDVKLIVDLAAGATVEMWIAYGADKVNVPMAAGTTAVMAPDLYPWIQSHQLIGFMGGLRGAADYEVMLDFPKSEDGISYVVPPSYTGRGIRGMPAQSATHVMIILLILGANLYVLSGWLFGRKKG